MPATRRMMPQPPSPGWMDGSTTALLPGRSSVKKVPVSVWLPVGVFTPRPSDHIAGRACPEG